MIKLKKKELRARALGKCNSRLCRRRHGKTALDFLHPLSLSLSLCRYLSLTFVLRPALCTRWLLKLSSSLARVSVFLFSFSRVRARAFAFRQEPKTPFFSLFYSRALCLCPLFFLLNLYLYFIFTKIYTNRLRIVINFN